MRCIVPDTNENSDNGNQKATSSECGVSFKQKSLIAIASHCYRSLEPIYKNVQANSYTTISSALTRDFPWIHQKNFGK